MRLFCGSLLALLSLAQPLGAFAQARLQVEGGNSFDLGNIYRGSVHERKLQLQNTGHDTLRIGHVDVSCGCTGTVVSQTNIAPGQSGTVLITFNSKNFAGPVHKTVTVHSNAADAEATLIEFTAHVIDEIVLSPPSIFFQEAEVKHTSVVTIKVTNNGMAPLSLTGFRSALKGFTLKLPSEPVATGTSAELRAEFTPEAPTPMIADGVFVTTNNVHQGEVYIQIFGSAKESKTP